MEVFATTTEILVHREKKPGGGAQLNWTELDLWISGC